MFSDWPWAKVFLIFDHAITLSGIIIFYPIFSRHGLGALSAFPSPYHLLVQVIQCFVVEYCCYRWLPRFPPCMDSEGEDLQCGDVKDFGESSGLATEYMVPKVTLILILVTGEISSGVRPFFGRFHLASVIVWMILRQYEVFTPYRHGDSPVGTRCGVNRSLT